MKTMNKLWLAAALIVAIWAPVQAQDLGGRKTVVCDDARVVLVTPFNAANPCSEVVVIDPAKDIPDEFLLVFGPPPQPTGRSLTDRMARIDYEQSLKVFRGLIDAPSEYFQKPRYQPTASQTIAEYYASWGLGEPVFYRDIYGSYVRWPHAVYGPARAPVSVVALAPGVVVATWQSSAIQRGVCVYDVMGFVPGWLDEQNDKNCEAQQAGAAQ